MRPERFPLSAFSFCDKPVSSFPALARCSTGSFFPNITLRGSFLQTWKIRRSENVIFPARGMERQVQNLPLGLASLRAGVPPQDESVVFNRPPVSSRVPLSKDFDLTPETFQASIFPEVGQRAGSRAALDSAGDFKGVRRRGSRYEDGASRTRVGVGGRDGRLQEEAAAWPGTGRRSTFGVQPTGERRVGAGCASWALRGRPRPHALGHATWLHRNEVTGHSSDVTPPPLGGGGRTLPLGLSR